MGFAGILSLFYLFLKKRRLTSFEYGRYGDLWLQRRRLGLGILTQMLGLSFGCASGVILPDRAYAFFSHTHKAQKESMPLLDKILTEWVSLYNYKDELIVGDWGRRLLAFGQFAGRAGIIDLHWLQQKYLSLGYSTPLSLGASNMYSCCQSCSNFSLR